MQLYRDQLHESLTRLAAPATDQLKHLRTLLSYPSTDELALDLYELVLLADQRVQERVITPAQRDAIQSVSEKLNAMSGPHNAHLWTPEGLLKAKEWQQVRELAAHSLKLLDLRAERASR
jgi:hypothetical protein